MRDRRLPHTQPADDACQPTLNWLTDGTVNAAYGKIERGPDIGQQQGLRYISVRALFAVMLEKLIKHRSQRLGVVDGLTKWYGVVGTVGHAVLGAYGNRAIQPVPQMLWIRIIDGHGRICGLSDGPNESHQYREPMPTHSLPPAGLNKCRGQWHRFVTQGRTFRLEKRGNEK